MDNTMFVLEIVKITYSVFKIRYHIAFKIMKARQWLAVWKVVQKKRSVI
jgi:hypothetical protein